MPPYITSEGVGFVWADGDALLVHTAQADVDYAGTLCEKGADIHTAVLSLWMNAYIAGAAAEATDPAWVRRALAQMGIGPDVWALRLTDMQTMTARFPLGGPDGD